jgi:hypothetical protein
MSERSYLEGVIREAREKLIEREQRLERLMAGARAEITELRHAIKKLEKMIPAKGEPRREQHRNGSYVSAEAQEKRNRVVKAMAHIEGPASLERVREAAQLDSARGLWPILESMRRDGVLVCDRGMWSLAEPNGQPA